MAVNRGPLDWSVERDDEGHRTYEVKWLIVADPADGPASILLSGVIANVGEIWNFSTDSIDAWAFTTPYVKVQRHDAKEGENGRHWAVTQRYTTKPVRPDRQRCQDLKIEDPLMEPPKVSGGFQKYTEEATRDRYGEPILNSSWELIRGQVVEFDANRPTVRVEQNVPLLGVEVFAPMIDTLNDSTLWGLPSRCWKLDNVSWERLYFGGCSVYYRRTLEFAGRFEGWDRTVQDEGSKVLNGDWSGPGGSWKVKPIVTLSFPSTSYSSASTSIDVGGLGTSVAANFAKVGIGMSVTGAGIDDGSLVTGKTGGSIIIDTPTSAAGTNVTVTVTQEANASNPAHFIRMKDKNGENIRVILDGHGVPWDTEGSTTGTGDDNPGSVFIQKYGESNFLLLGIPTVL